MIVTVSAKQELRRRLAAHSNDREIGLRLELKPPGHFSLVLDGKARGDRVIQYRGSKVLLIGEGVADVVDRLTLDVQTIADNPALVLSKTHGQGPIAKEAGYTFRESRTALWVACTQTGQNDKSLPQGGSECSKEFHCSQRS